MTMHGSSGSSSAVALVGDHEPGSRHLQAQLQVVRAQLLGARQHDEALAEAGEHRQRPLGARADEREHDVAARHAEGVQAPGQPRRGVRKLAERPFAARAVAPQLDQRAPVPRRRFD
jgi:hypothetical protein